MDFRSTATTLKASGYPPRKADAKIAHDIVFKAIEDAGFHDKVTIKGGVVLLVNPKEQIFIEKLKSLLRLGVVSTRYKDVYDLFYLCSRVDTNILGEYLHMCIFEDEAMLENDVRDIERRLGRIFSSKTFLKRMANPDYAWLDEPVETVVGTLLEFFKGL